MKIQPARKGTLKRLVGFVFKEHKWQLVVVVISMLISSLMNVLAMSVIQDIVNVALEIVNSGSKDLTPVFQELGKMAFYYVFVIIFSFTYLRIMIFVGQNSLLRLREELFNHMIKLPVKFFDENQHGNLMSIFTNDINATRQMISQSIPQVIESTLRIIFYVIAMIITAPSLSIITIILGIVLISLSQYVTSTSGPYFKKQQEAVGALNGFIEEMVEGQKVVKIFRREEKVVEDFDVINEELTKQSVIAGKRLRTLNPMTISIGYFGYVIVAIVGGVLAASGRLETSALILFLVYTRSFFGPFNNISNQLSFIGQAQAGADRVFRALEETPEVDRGTYYIVNAKQVDGKLVKTEQQTNIKAWYNPVDGNLVRFRGDIRFKNVTFGYDDVPVLKDVSLFAKPGQKIAFVGATGAGKTTIANLINRFYDINEGEITFDGINMLDIKKDCLRNSIAVVLQNTSLFTTTVKENIRYGNLSATDEEVVSAAKSANAHEFITKLPQGYETILAHDGENLSAGQRQLLSIARAIIANRPVLILDEATSSVDTYTEQLIQEAMDELMKGRTVFVIAHRLSTIQDANAIIVLEQGQIIERGEHDYLLDSRGRYYELYMGLVEFE